jgi:hypothetical protein
MGTRAYGENGAVVMPQMMCPSGIRPWWWCRMRGERRWPSVRSAAPSVPLIDGHGVWGWRSRVPVGMTLGRPLTMEGAAAGRTVEDVRTQGARGRDGPDGRASTRRVMPSRPRRFVDADVGVARSDRMGPLTLSGRRPNGTWWRRDGSPCADDGTQKPPPETAAGLPDRRSLRAQESAEESGGGHSGDGRSNRCAHAKDVPMLAAAIPAQR